MVNKDGHVVGVVSTGMTFAASGSVVFFSGSGLAETMFPMVDPGAPGQIFCWGGFGKDDKVAMIAPTQEALMAMKGASDLKEVGRISFNTRTGDYICV